MDVNISKLAKTAALLVDDNLHIKELLHLLSYCTEMQIDKNLPLNERVFQLNDLRNDSVENFIVNSDHLSRIFDNTKYFKNNCFVVPKVVDNG